jgi:lysophospholipase L1-like esterase
MTAVQVAPWLALRQEILAMQGTGAVVLDATAVLGNVTNGTFDGTFLPGLSTDGVHPNDYGHSLVATLLTNAVTGLMDLS